MLCRSALWGGLLAALAAGCSASSPPASSAATGTTAGAAKGARATEPESDAGAPDEARSETDAPDAGEDDDGIEDGFDDDAPATAGANGAPEHPLARLTDAEIEARLRNDPRSLGSLSIGRPSAGALSNGVQLESGEYWTVVAPAGAWGTEETVRYLTTAILKVAAAFPGTQKLSVGHISAERGGPLSPHLSHQSGRDVDLSYYYKDGERWYKRANGKNLDVERTWALVRAFVCDTDVELILIDHSIQRLLRAHAEKIGEDREWLDGLFKGKGALRPIIRHAKGHATHLHVRFFNPIAQETARRALGPMVRLGLVKEPPRYVHHLVKKGDTLDKLAKRYGTTIREIQRANGLRSTIIQAKKRYVIPQKGGGPLPVDPPMVLPPRRLPPKR